MNWDSEIFGEDLWHQGSLNEPYSHCVEQYESKDGLDFEDQNCRDSNLYCGESQLPSRPAFRSYTQIDLADSDLYQNLNVTAPTATFQTTQISQQIQGNPALVVAPASVVEAVPPASTIAMAAAINRLRAKLQRQKELGKNNLFKPLLTLKMNLLKNNKKFRSIKQALDEFYETYKGTHSSSRPLSEEALIRFWFEYIKKDEKLTQSYCEFIQKEFRDAAIDKFEKKYDAEKLSVIMDFLERMVEASQKPVTDSFGVMCIKDRNAKNSKKTFFKLALLFGKDFQDEVIRQTQCLRKITVNG